MAELEEQFNASEFDLICVQEGRMSEKTTLRGMHYDMFVFPGVGPSRALGLQFWVGLFIPSHPLPRTPLLRGLVTAP